MQPKSAFISKLTVTQSEVALASCYVQESDAAFLLGVGKSAISSVKGEVFRRFNQHFSRSDADMGKLVVTLLAEGSVPLDEYKEQMRGILLPLSSRKSIHLTPREESLVACLFQGKNDIAIAESFGITRRTVNYELSNLYAKWQVSGRIEAIGRAALLGYLAIENGSFKLISPPLD